jgi:hypothetical protein
VAGTADWVLVPEVEELGAVFEKAEELLLALAVSEEDSAEDPDPWVLPAPLAGREALAALNQVWAVLRDSVDELARPRIEPDDSTRPRLFSGGRERVPFRAVQVDAGDRQLVAAAVVQLELSLSPSARREAGNPWERKRLSDLAELLEQIADGATEATTAVELIRPLVRLSALLNLPPDDDTRILVATVRHASADVELTPSQATAYGKTATRLNTILTGGDPLAGWVY